MTHKPRKHGDWDQFQRDNLVRTSTQLSGCIPNRTRYRYKINGNLILRNTPTQTLIPYLISRPYDIATNHKSYRHTLIARSNATSPQQYMKSVQQPHPHRILHREPLLFLVHEKKSLRRSRLPNPSSILTFHAITPTCRIYSLHKTCQRISHLVTCITS